LGKYNTDSENHTKHIYLCTVRAIRTVSERYGRWYIQLPLCCNIHWRFVSSVYEYPPESIQPAVSAEAVMIPHEHRWHRVQVMSN